MIGRPFLAFALGLLLVAGPAWAGVPETPRSDVTRTWHGREVAEPYAWLEDADSQAVRDWAREQDGWSRRFLGEQHADELRRDIIDITNVTRFMPPVVRGGRYFHATIDGGAPSASAWVQETFYGAPELLLGPGAGLHEGELLHYQLWPSPDGRWLAYGVTDGPSRWMELRFLELASRKTLPERLTGLVAMSSAVSWAADSSGVFYERFTLPPVRERLTSLLHDENVYRHVLRTKQRQDVVVYDSQHPDNDVVTHALTDDGRFLVVSVRDGRDNYNRVLATHTATPDAGFRELTSGIKANFRLVGSRGDEVWLQTDFEAPRGRVIGVRWDAETLSGWREIVPEHADATIDTWVGASGAGEGMVIGYRRDSRLHFEYHGADGEMLRRFEPPNLSSVWTGLVGRQGEDAVFFTVSSFADPGTVYRMLLSTGQQTPFRAPELPYDPREIVVEQVFYESPSRKRVPMFLAYHEDTPPDGTRPVMMYGYGFGGWIAAPWFRPHLPQWFRSGGAFALPALRGGGEYGDDWHRAGSRTRKIAAVDDFIAAAEWLVQAELARPALLVAETNSAGGPVVGAAILQRPDLFGAALLAFPLLDMLVYEQYTHAGRWRSELGSTRDPEEFAALLAYSPPHNVRADSCYPPVLVTPGALDEVTPPVHSFKFVAALQHAGNCNNPALLRLSWNAGHAYGGTAAETAETYAAQLLFLRKVLELSP